MYEELNMEKYTLPRVKCTANAHWLCDSGSSDWGSVTPPEGWEGGSKGRGHRYTCGRFILMFGRNQHDIVEQLPFN